MSRTPLIAGNWKMHGTIAEAEDRIASLLPRIATADHVEHAVCVPFTALQASVDSTRGSALSASQQAAAKPGDPAAMQGLAQAEGALGGALGRLLAVFEQYPDLKANQNVLGLQEELSSTENKISFSRQAYNDSVMEYNTKRESFPDNIFAGMFGFGPAELLQATESPEERKAPQVRF